MAASDQNIDVQISDAPASPVQFGLRVLFAVVVVAAVFTAWLGPYKWSELTLDQAKKNLQAPIVQGFSDPNAIVYDEVHFRSYALVREKAGIACGIATYEVVTANGPVRFQGGLYPTRLGHRFHYLDLMTFVKTRVDNSKDTYQWDKGDAELNKMIRTSPYESDLRICIDLLGDVQVVQAVPLLMQLLSDSHVGIRRSAVMALPKMGGSAKVAIFAIESLAKSESNSDLRFEVERAIERLKAQ